MIKKKNLLIGLIIMIISLVGVTFAKFIAEDYHGYFTNAKEFSFTSNVLKPNGTTIYTLNNWSGVGAFDITFDLSTKKNNLYYVDYDVPYEVFVDCPDNVECSLESKSGVIYASDPDHTDTVVIHVQPLEKFNEHDTLLIEITAKSTFPYEQNLYADFFYQVAQSGISYTLTDYGPVYAKLTITNAKNYYIVKTAFGDYQPLDRISIDEYRELSQEDKTKCEGTEVSVSFDANALIIDSTDNIIETNNYTTNIINGIPYINSFTTNINPMSAIDVKFYKVNAEDVFSTNAGGYAPITVTELGGR